MKLHNERLYARIPLPLQNALVSVYGWQVLRRRSGPDLEAAKRVLKETERYDLTRLREWQDEKLKGLILYAYETVPYYRELMDSLHLRPSDVETMDDLTKLPVLTREDIREHGERMLSSTVKGRSLRQVATSGTTGAPITIFWDRGVEVFNNACMHRFHQWAGIGPREPFATLMGRPTVPLTQTKPPFWRYNSARRQLLLSTLHLRPDNISSYARELRRRRIAVLEAYPSSAYILARLLKDAGEDLSFRVVTLTGEPLLPPVRSFIEERFQCETFDAYGSAERTLFAAECEQHDGLHIFEEYGVTEIVDGDGQRLPSGDSGRIVATSLHNRATPLIRYACGDIGTISETPCSCGRSHPLFEDLTTREEDILVLPDGRLLPPLFLLSGYGCITGIRKAQVLQSEPSAIHIKLETDHPLIAAEVALLMDYLTKRLGNGVRITLERVDEIPLSPLGKFRRVISTVPLPGNNGFGRATPPQDPSDNHA